MPAASARLLIAVAASPPWLAADNNDRKIHHEDTKARCKRKDSLLFVSSFLRGESFDSGFGVAADL
jgi:hypothetical protein